MFLYGQKNLIPPDIQMAGDFHCSVDPTPEGYKATATVTYLNPTKYHGGTPWVVLLTELKGKNRKKLRTAAEKACNEWLDAIDKVRAEVMPVDAKSRRKE